jgi:hypothetical protein
MRRHRSFLQIISFRSFILAAICACSAPSAWAQQVLYDDFMAPLLDGTRWTGRQFNSGDGNASSLEIERSIANGRLLMRARVIGREAGEGERSSETALLFRRPGALDEVSFQVAVRDLQVAGCASGASSSAGARGVYAFFNDGEGDVVATIEVKRSSGWGPENLLEVVGTLVRRGTDGDTLLGSVPLGSALIGQRVKLRVKWHKATSEVRFQKDQDPAASIAYTNPVVGQAAAERKYLGLFGMAGGCSESSASAAALFNNVRVNP